MFCTDAQPVSSWSTGRPDDQRALRLTNRLTCCVLRIMTRPVNQWGRLVDQPEGQ